MDQLAVVLSSGDLTRMRNDQHALLPDTCTVKTPTVSTSSYGGETRTWTDTTGVACRVARNSTVVRARQDMLGEQPTVTADWMVTLPYNQTISLGCLIVTATHTLEIVDIQDDESWITGKRVLCREVGRG